MQELGWQSWDTNCRLPVDTKDEIPALEARVYEAPDAGVVAHLDILDVLADLGHHAGNLVSWDQWKGDGHRQGVPRKVDVGVTDAAVLDVDGHVVGAAGVPLEAIV